MTVPAQTLVVRSFCTPKSQRNLRWNSAHHYQQFAHRLNKCLRTSTSIYGHAWPPTSLPKHTGLRAGLEGSWREKRMSERQQLELKRFRSRPRFGTRTTTRSKL